MLFISLFICVFGVQLVHGFYSVKTHKETAPQSHNTGKRTQSERIWHSFHNLPEHATSNAVFSKASSRLISNYDMDQTEIGDYYDDGPEIIEAVVRGKHSSSKYLLNDEPVIIGSVRRIKPLNKRRLRITKDSYQTFTERVSKNKSYTTKPTAEVENLMKKNTSRSIKLIDSLGNRTYVQGFSNSSENFLPMKKFSETINGKNIYTTVVTENSHSFVGYNSTKSSRENLVKPKQSVSPEKENKKTEKIDKLFYEKLLIISGVSTKKSLPSITEAPETKSTVESTQAHRKMYKNSHFGEKLESAKKLQTTQKPYTTEKSTSDYLNFNDASNYYDDEKYDYYDYYDYDNVDFVHGASDNFEKQEKRDNFDFKMPSIYPSTSKLRKKRKVLVKERSTQKPQSYLPSEAAEEKSEIVKNKKTFPEHLISKKNYSNPPLKVEQFTEFETGAIDSIKQIQDLGNSPNKDPSIKVVDSEYFDDSFENLDNMNSENGINLATLSVQSYHDYLLDLPDNSVNLLDMEGPSVKSLNEVKPASNQEKESTIESITKTEFVTIQTNEGNIDVEKMEDIENVYENILETLKKDGLPYVSDEVINKPKQKKAHKKRSKVKGKNTTLNKNPKHDSKQPPDVNLDKDTKATEGNAPESESNANKLVIESLFIHKKQDDGSETPLLEAVAVKNKDGSDSEILIMDSAKGKLNFFKPEQDTLKVAEAKINVPEPFSQNAETEDSADSGSGRGNFEDTDFQGTDPRAWSMTHFLSQERRKFKRCVTSSNETGNCMPIHLCSVPQRTSSIDELLQNVCTLEEMFIGICCPEFPAETLKVKWESGDPVENGTGGHAKECGKLPSVIGDDEAWPWMASLISTASEKVFCGGVLITDQYVLTAAHCTSRIPGNRILVRLERTTSETFSREFPVVEIKRHAQYNSRTMRNDIALLKLVKKVPLGALRQMVCMPDGADEDYANENAVLLPWEGVPGEIESLQVITNRQCKSQMGNLISDAVLCTKPRSSDTRCNADSGAPLVISKEGKFKVIGILTWNRNDCDGRFPAIFTRVSAYRGWIFKHTV